MFVKMNVYVLVMVLLARATSVVFALSKDPKTAFPTDTKAPINARRRETKHVPTSLEASASDQNLPNDPYMNYLLVPHLHFSGTFRADVSTVNNDPDNYNTETFVPYYDPGFNPLGTGEWSVNGSITQVCYADGHCTDHDDDEEKVKGEPLLGALVSDGGNMTTAKLVDLDTEAQLFSEIWGWRIRIGDFFSADYSPVPFQYIWKKSINDPRGDHSYGAAYQSVLSNIRWIDKQNGNSSFINQLREAMEEDNIDNNKLSIRFNVDLYETDYTKDNFTNGRITGTIGLMGRKSPMFFTRGRMMRTLTNLTQNAPFYVDATHRRVSVDFGNSIVTDEYGAMDTILQNDLLVAVHLDTDVLKCSSNLLLVGLVRYNSPNWYRDTAGVQIFPASGSLSDEVMMNLANHSLVVAELKGKDCKQESITCCKRILLAEAQDGVHIHPYSNWTFRKNPEETANVQLLVTRFGNPLPGVHVNIDPCNCKNIFSGGPDVGKPPLPLQDRESITDEDGIATFHIMAKDPQNNRDFIDGQLYPFFYFVKEHPRDSCSNMCENDTFQLLNSLFVILVWDNFKQKGEEPTWLDDVYPIFKQYANLYPVMTNNFVDLGNYYDVVKHNNAIRSSMELPRFHPNHMPVTRDLSTSKRKVILKWLSQESPAIGDPTHFYSVDQLRKDLQTALQLEHATIPPYLTALASIKFSYNLEIQNILETIIIQEMMHMALVANILNAVGGQPSLYSNDFLPRYPSRLPGGVQADLIVPIEKLSLGLVRNIFMKIEQPVLEQERIASFQHVFDYAEKMKKKMGMEKDGHCKKTEKGEPMCLETDTLVDPTVDDTLLPCLISPTMDQSLKDSIDKRQKLNRKPDHDSKEDGSAQHDRKKKLRHFPRDDRVIVKNNNTIGGFYIHILNTLANLTNCGRDNSIFTGNKSRQVNVKHWSVQGQPLEVYDYFTAVEAIQLIIEQGEGSSPCNPVSWNTESGKSLSHYFLFHSVAEKREIRVFNKTKNHTLNEDGGDRPVIDHSQKVCNGTYHFTGPKIPFDPEGVWPMIANPRMTKYEQNSKAHLQAEKFNKVYTKLLKSLDHMFNGHPDTLKDAFGLMYSVDLHLRKLVHTPVYDNGDPEIGPNAGPTFDFTPGYV